MRHRRQRAQRARREHKHVQAAEPRMYAEPDPLRLSRVRQIQRQQRRGAASGTDRIIRRLEPTLGSRGQDHVQPPPAELDRDSLADPPARAGDQRDPPLRHQAAGTSRLECPGIRSAASSTGIG